MESVHIKESNSEILIFLDYNYSTKLAALQEGMKALQREVIRHETYYRAHPDRETNPY